MRFIIHPQINDDGTLSDQIVIVHPSPNCGLTLEEVASKDTPPGVPFLLVDSIPSDRLFRAAWEADFSNPDGYGQEAASNDLD